MALRLRIISDHRRSLGERSTATFGASGGRIGRSADNDWVLPDPQRYVSAHHARIHYREGEYLLEDTSTNGTFLNDDDRPISKLGPRRLQNGDLLRVGDYQLVVAIDAPSASEAGAGTTDPVPTRIDVLQSVGRAAQTDLGAALNLDDLLMTDHSGTRMGPVNAYGQVVPLPTSRSPAQRPPESRPPELRPPEPRSPEPRPSEPLLGDRPPEPSDPAIARRLERMARAVEKSREERPGASLPALYDVQSGLRVFCRGAGIDAEKLPPDSQTRMLHLVGQLLREMLVGLKDLERTRHEMHNRFRISWQSDPEDPRPSLERSTVEELLVQILAQHESRRLDAVQWLRELIEGTKIHERAVTDALRAAFVDFVARLDPTELESRFQRTGRRGKTSGGESQYWALFVEFYRNLTEMPPDHLPHTFVEAFANAYLKARSDPQSESSPRAGAG
jgi:type VI secretion system protein